jgi:peptide/nickel transport system substrate-binding protein
MSMKKRPTPIDTVRGGRSELENDLFDELLSGRIGRREFLRHGSVLGLSLPFLGGLASAVFGPLGVPKARAAGAAGATLRIGLNQPAGAIDPVSIADNAGLILLHQAGELLCRTGPDLVLQPVLAESWSPNNDGSVWTFKIRKGVKFQDGRAMTAADVVATIDRLADPKNSSNALSAFKGNLQKGNSKKIDDYTIEFHLDVPNGNFPYLLSSDNYNLVILPADYAGGYEESFPGTGPFKLEKFTPKVGATFVRNPDYWGKPALPARLEFSFYGDMQAQVLALQGGQLDILQQVPFKGSQALFSNPDLEVISLKSVSHQQVHMRTDMAPFTDKRVRRALSLTLDRKKIVAGLFNGRATVGNDSPFSPLFPSTDASVPQREQNLQEAKQLMEAAGAGKGFAVKLTTEVYLEIPDYAVLIQNAAKAIGVDIQLNVEQQDAYYGKAVFGQSDWLDSVLGITDYGHRGVPNVFLSAPLLSEGSWNSAHFKHAEYDKLVAQYIASPDLGGQRSTASKIQKLLLEETPIITSYFFDELMPVRKGVGGIPAIPNRLFLEGAYSA